MKSPAYKIRVKRFAFLPFSTFTALAHFVDKDDVLTITLAKGGQRTIPGYSKLHVKIGYDYVLFLRNYSSLSAAEVSSAPGKIAAANDFIAHDAIANLKAMREKLETFGPSAGH